MFCSVRRSVRSEVLGSVLDLSVNSVDGLRKATDLSVSPLHSRDHDYALPYRIILRTAEQRQRVH